MSDDLILSPGVSDQLERLRLAVCSNPPGAPWNVLLWGDPGTGKTALRRAFAASVASCGRNSLTLNFDNFRGSYVGQTAAAVCATFDRIRAAAPVVVSLDLEQGPYSDDCLLPSLESLSLGRNLDGSDVERRTEFIMQLDALRAKRVPVWILAEIFHPDRLDRAVRSRFDGAIELPLPDETARREILKRKIAAVPNPAFDVEEISSMLAAQTAGKSGRALEHIVFSACDAAARRALDPGATQSSPTREDFLLAAPSS